MRKVLLFAGMVLLLAGCASNSSENSPKAKKSYEEYDKKAEEHLLNEMTSDKEETKDRYELIAFDGFEEEYDQMLYKATFYNPVIKDDSLYMISVVKNSDGFEVKNGIYSIEGNHFRENPLKDKVLREDEESIGAIKLAHLERLIKKYPEKSYTVGDYPESQ